MTSYDCESICGTTYLCSLVSITVHILMDVAPFEIDVVMRSYSEDFSDHILRDYPGRG
jgi:hypothetical protein